MTDGSTHWALCWKEGGPRHWACAVTVVEQLLEGNARLVVALQEAQEREAALERLLRDTEPMIAEYMVNHPAWAAEAKRLLDALGPAAGPAPEVR